MSMQKHLQFFLAIFIRKLSYKLSCTAVSHIPAEPLYDPAGHNVHAEAPALGMGESNSRCNVLTCSRYSEKVKKWTFLRVISMMIS